ncbi:hypothetical protein U1Q18_037412, partial [Sarracenia purpurea var. burkii]
AFVLKYLLFVPDELDQATTNVPQTFGSSSPSRSECSAADDVFSYLTEDRMSR